MCEKCEAREAQEQLAQPGVRIVAVASVDDSSVLMYGHGVFARWDFPPGVKALTPEDDKYREIAHHQEGINTPEARKKLRVMLAMNGYTGEQLAEFESKLDERARVPLEERVAEVWFDDQRVPYLTLDSGEEIYAATFGAEGDFEEFVGDRVVVEVPFMGGRLPAEAE
jgi:hypothetical protein